MDAGPVTAVLQHIRSLAAARAASHLADGPLLERFLASGEEAAFAALLQRHGPMVWRVCHRLLRHRQDAEDTFQATFLTLALKAASIRKLASVACWLHGVAYRLGRRLQAELAREHRRETGSTTHDPAEQASGRELQAVLDEELAALAEKYRMPVVLCFLEGKTRDEAAAYLGWSLSTFKRRLDRGRAMLSARLTRRGLSLGVALLTGGLFQEAALAAVPPTLMGSSCNAALLITRGKTLAGNVSPRVAALTRGVVKAMMITKLQRAASVIAAAVLLTAGVGWWTAHQMQAAQTPALGAGLEQDKAPAKLEVQPDGAALIKRGAYLVNTVARCGDCHTPRNAKGQLDMSRHMQGASMWFTPKAKGKGEWEDHASDITASGKAGKWTEAKMVKFLSTGEKSDPPMPAYNLTLEDAQAVTAYLRSLPGKKKDAAGNKNDD
jgi:RNA polymerase sigma factor (sigma-70 family)